MKLYHKVIRALRKRMKWINSNNSFWWGAFRFIPLIPNKIVISSYFGSGFCDNPKYIVQELIKHTNKVSIIWLVKDLSEANSLPGFVSPCLIDSRSAVYHLSTASVWIDNSRKINFKKKKKQLYIQTWHGNCTGKKIEKDAEDKLSKTYVDIAKKDSAAIDLVISDSQFMTKIYKRSFWYNGLVAEIGSPRNDILLDGSTHDWIKKKVYCYFGIDKNKEIILYAPTFRNSGSLEVYNLDYERLIFTCEQKYNQNYVVIVRLHPNVAEKSDLLPYSNNIINGSHYQDVQELLVAASIVISDYSSIMYDFTIKNGISIRYAPDLNHYLEERGWYFDLDDYPYPVAKNNDELDQLIDDFNYETYLTRVNDFHEKCGLVRRPSSRICADIICSFIDSKMDKQYLAEKYREYIE